MDTIDIEYRILLADGGQEEFRIQLDPDTLVAVSDAAEDQPEWTRLDYHQCINCPWSVEEHPHCPVATRLVPVVTRLGHARSFDEIRLEVETAERTVVAKPSAQEGISSLIGLLVATSGCPHADFFKPMARFHLPVASSEETVYRVVSMYAVSQLLRWRRGQSVDGGFDELMQRYEAMRIVNRSIAERLKAADEDNNAVNSIIVLDYTAQLLPVSLQEELEELERLFHGFLED